MVGNGNENLYVVKEEMGKGTGDVLLQTHDGCCGKGWVEIADEISSRLIPFILPEAKE